MWMLFDCFHHILYEDCVLTQSGDRLTDEPRPQAAKQLVGLCSVFGLYLLCVCVCVSRFLVIHMCQVSAYASHHEPLLNQAYCLRSGWQGCSSSRGKI